MTSPPLRIAFAGTPDFAAGHLASLVEKGFDVVGVLSQPDRPAGRGKKIRPTPVKQVAQQHNIPVFQPDRLDDDALETLASLAPDVLVVVAYGVILKQAALELPRLGCLNVHASLLPRWRGAAPIERAIMAGDSETGISIMQMNEGLDTGDVLLRLSTSISNDDNAQTVSDRLLQLGCEGLVRVLGDLPAYQADAEKQDESLACYAAKLTKDDAQVDWSQPAIRIQHQAQAFFPRSPAWFYLGNDRLRIISARAMVGTAHAEPGTILAYDKTHLLIACGEGSLEITRLQLPGKKPAALQDIANGHPRLFPQGQVLPIKESM